MPSTRPAVVDAIAARADLSVAQAEAALSALQELIVDSLTAGELVRIPGFLSAERVARPERAGRNPRTGEPLTIPAGFGVRLVAGTTLKRAVQG